MRDRLRELGEDVDSLFPSDLVPVILGLANQVDDFDDDAESKLEDEE